MSQDTTNWDALRSTAKSVLESLQSGNWSAATQHFDKTMSEVMAADKLEGVWTSIQSQVGKFEKVANDRHEKVQQFPVVFLTCKFEHALLDLKMVFDAGKITGLMFIPAQT